jgi:two-component system phosphate regulon sensor histidine kinase PhoR
MNQMAAHLDDRIRTVLRQRNEQEAVLASMVEGVLAVDLEERILRLNRAAGRLLGVRPEQAEGRRIQEVVRKADLQRFVARALANREPVEGDIVLRDAEEGERFLQAHGTVLRGAQGQEIGALIVLNDVTRLRRLETLRRDFVANVSHELKTPITAIKGFVETLLDGAVADPDDAQRFLQIITRQADRLNAIIDDLLDLSRIEQEAEKGGIPLARGALRPVLEAAVQACSMSAREKPLQIVLHCSGELAAQINAPLLEQAIVNLLTNAIKYSEPAGRVVVDAAQFGDKVMVKVQDWGCGISPEHLPRLFERFYRVDKARSRKQGGTGLGLAIVKHIVQSHGGEVVVHSTPGQGSTFTLILPAVS